MKKYFVICMSFDGQYQREYPLFNSIPEASEYASNLGSKWYFYPYTFICSGKSITEAGYGLEHFEGKRITTIQKIFKKLNDWCTETGNDLNAEEFWFKL